MSPEQLWASKYAQKHAEERALEEAKREQAFLNLPIIVAGEPLRAMTPLDLLTLNGIESCFVCPVDPTPEGIAMFFWVLHSENDGSDGWFARRKREKMVRRLAPQNYDALIKAGRDYVDEIFQDAGTPSGEISEKRPLGTCFLAPLVMNLALETGWSQHEILSTPLPRLFQYQKAMRARTQGKEFVDFSPSDRLTSEFLNELNHKTA